MRPKTAPPPFPLSCNDPIWFLGSISTNRKRISHAARNPAAAHRHRPIRPPAPDTSSEEPFVADPDDLPPELAFDPVPQQTKRWAGINSHKQRMFVAHLAATGSVAMAAKAAGHSTSAFYQLRKREGAAGFAAA